MSCRAATHAGSWYSGDRNVLTSQLDAWLAQVDSEIDTVGKLPIEGARIIIAPHAGYSYSGPAAAWAYRSLDVSKAKRVFVLGPSHHVYLDGCALSSCTTYETPLGNLELDTETLSHLESTGMFKRMNLETDQDEHSLEMHLPYVYKVLDLAGKLPSVKTVPIMIGAISTKKEKDFGKVLAEYLADPENCFVVSSDFCHWGSRFSFTHYYTELPASHEVYSKSTSLSSRSERPSSPQIFESIEALDRQGMTLIETGSHDAFAEYLKKTRNTICGRHPIGVVLAAIETLGLQGKGKFRFIRYEQSSKVRESRDSSVSYASAFAVL